MKIMLIGATGFVVSATLKEGMQRGHEVPAIVRHTERLTSYPAPFHGGLLRSDRLYLELPITL
jgi:putative NADH-flavin reductase